MKVERKIIFFKNYFIDFYLKLSPKAQEKFDYVFRVVRTVERVPERFLKHIEGTKGLYELRVEFESNAYRVFCCFDSGNLVVLFNPFQKKAQRTPPNEIELALRLMNEYHTKKGLPNGKKKITP